MIKEVFLVGRGVYSDFGIEAVYSTSELAQIFVDQNEDESMCILPYELDVEADKMALGYKMYTVIMLEDGNAVKINRGLAEGAYIAMQFTQYGHFDYDGYKIKAKVWAMNETHAIKITNEKRIAYKATYQWPTNHVEMCDSNEVLS